MKSLLLAHKIDQCSLARTPINPSKMHSTEAWLNPALRATLTGLALEKNQWHAILTLIAVSLVDITLTMCHKLNMIPRGGRVV